MSQSIEQLAEAILTLPDSLRLRLFKSLRKTLTLQGLLPLEGIALERDQDGNAVASKSGTSTDQNSAKSPDPIETALAMSSPGTEPTGASCDDDLSLQAYVGTVTRYELVRALAEGGLGRVWIARDIDLGRQVALKQVKAPFADNPDFQARFLFEAKALANLEHPGVVGIYGQGRDASGRPFFVMKLVSGKTFGSEINGFHARKSWRPNEKLLELRRLLSAFIAVCNVVAYAHSRGVLHRDIKPENVILGKYGETLLLDWGLAKVLFLPDPHGDQLEGRSAFHPDDFHGRTEFGAVVGTPAYMSPEQAAGRNDLLEPATDIYSLGATLYEVLTGRTPHHGEELSGLLKNVAQGTFRRPREISSEIPAALEAVCLKAMALRPEERYASATAVADDIERWLAGAPTSVHHTPFWRSLDFLRRW